MGVCRQPDTPFVIHAGYSEALCGKRSASPFNQTSDLPSLPTPTAREVPQHQLYGEGAQASEEGGCGAFHSPPGSWLYRRPRGDYTVSSPPAAKRPRRGAANAEDGEYSGPPPEDVARTFYPWGGRYYRRQHLKEHRQDTPLGGSKRISLTALEDPKRRRAASPRQQACEVALCWDDTPVHSSGEGSAGSSAST